MTDTSPSERTAQTLKRIATALRCTVDDLANGKDDGRPVAEARELLTLWDAIEGDAGRRTVLEVARAVVRAQSAPPTP
ncbi:hypothetical protein AFCDBAGC_2858 [Methylobacterium cerastii]|uniref:HTH cro/C1-type domain-containing protein n=1 Tax=Methylobacterium cerastii TaxID=932741 RepID=A0ABQ4QJR6_9HYPH|nr:MULTISPECIES: hypothetical protein [Methylobacterium]TXM86086.1 hypothetical protein FV219_26680 [Methylobacterium sp. WL122]TXM64891.1 hypothetical protein FV226_25855 [Methylobacterium sp. WL12]TXM92757.1 hypothetical protein FV222_23050 [Methylobacterium sp. WL103]TXN77090.1 hypothetical protein FV234_24020 [Methylobacterium sp. WL8]GJD44989.1 hypothetical protein AFCDBAGC_2858 [Methylobacterium cerastii]